MKSSVVGLSLRLRVDDTFLRPRQGREGPKQAISRRSLLLACSPVSFWLCPWSVHLPVSKCQLCPYAELLICYDPPVIANGPFHLKAGPESRQKNINWSPMRAITSRVTLGECHRLDRCLPRRLAAEDD